MGRDRNSGIKWGGMAELRRKKAGKRDLRTPIVDPLIPLELQPTLSMSSRKAREAYLIDRGKTLSPDGLNRRN